MKRKKEQTVERDDKMKKLKRLHAKWKEKQRLNERSRIEEYLINEPEELDLEIHQ